MIQAVVVVAGILMTTCLVVGGLIAAGVLLWAREPEAAVQWIGNGYSVLVGLMPLALWLALRVSQGEADHAPAYATPLSALLTTLQGALVGSILGAGPIFLTVVILLPVMVAGFEPDSYGLAVRDSIVSPRLVLAVGAAAICALPLGLWAHYAGRGLGDD